MSREYEDAVRRGVEEEMQKEYQEKGIRRCPRCYNMEGRYDSQLIDCLVCKKESICLRCIYAGCSQKLILRKNMRNRDNETSYDGVCTACVWKLADWREGMREFVGIVPGDKEK